MRALSGLMTVRPQMNFVGERAQNCPKYGEKETYCMADTPNIPTPCMRIANSQLKLEQIQAAMQAMMDQAQATSDTPVCRACRKTPSRVAVSPLDSRPSLDSLSFSSSV